ncbi:MAG: hypothetical protein JWO13_1987 [Acidobacteriales bacterium]|nr:hypothetical protein [Terriglobales bacterium]
MARQQPLPPTILDRHLLFLLISRFAPVCFLQMFGAVASDKSCNLEAPVIFSTYSWDRSASVCKL